jgi:hypothetical protein
VLSRLRRHRYRDTFLGLAGVVALVSLDQYVGDYQSRELARRKALKAELDWLSFQGLRTGIDEITFDGAAYQIRFRLQNATDKPFFVLVPVIEGFVQIGPKWEQFSMKIAQQDMHQGMVIELVGERAFTEVASIADGEYTEPIPGYRHVKITLEAYLSPAASPREEIGQHREDFFLFLRDGKRDAELAVQKNRFRPSFIPLRGWTLLPK